jgi:hypothetical protein
MFRACTKTGESHIRRRCDAEITPALVMEPGQHSWPREEQVRQTRTSSCDLTGPSIALSRACYFSGSILRGFDPLTIVSYPRSRCLLVQRFPAHPPHVPLRANRYATSAYLFRHLRPLLGETNRAGEVRNRYLHHTCGLFTAQSSGTRTDALCRSMI